jgi:hypothetical protein
MRCLAIVVAISGIANAQLGDETSLIQVQKALKYGSGRDAPLEKATPADDKEFLVQEGSTELVAETEAFELEETTGPTPPPGCQDMGCIGKGPACGGNDFDCTRMGWVTTGYYKSCSLKDTCTSGFKVRCAKCATPSPPAATMPPPGTVAPWVTPAPAPTPLPSTFTPAPPVAPTLPTLLGFRPFENHGVVPEQDVYTIDNSNGYYGGTCLCPDGIEYGVGDDYHWCNGWPNTAQPNCYGGHIVGQCNTYYQHISTTYKTGWSYGSVTCANPDIETPLNLLIKALNNATSRLKGLNANATKSKKMEKRAGKGARSARKSAVKFAKKVSLSNISIHAATAAMSTAYFSQKAAAETAQTALQEMKNAHAHMRHYEKVYIDKEQVVKDAESALKVGKDAYKKAKSDLKIAKKAQKVMLKFEKAKMKSQAKGAKRQLKSAESESIKWGMEQAYLESSSPDRNMSNVPPYGRGGKKWNVGFGRMGKR